MLGRWAVGLCRGDLLPGIGEGILVDDFDMGLFACEGSRLLGFSWLLLLVFDWLTAVC